MNVEREGRDDPNEIWITLVANGIEIDGWHKV